MLKDRLRGCVELSAFLKDGLERFDGDPKFVLLSFLVPVLIIPIIAAFNITMPNIGYVDYLQEMANIFMLWMLSTLIFMGIFYVTVDFINTGGDFSKFIEIYNWLTLPAFILQLPFLLLATMGIMSWESAIDYIFIQLLLVYAMLAFVIMHNFRINILVGICFALLDMMCFGFVNQIIA